MIIETAESDLLTLSFGLTRDGAPLALSGDSDGFDSFAFRCRVKTADGDRLLEAMTDADAAERGDSDARFVFDLGECAPVPGRYPFELLLCRRAGEEILTRQTIGFADENALIIHPKV